MKHNPAERSANASYVGDGRASLDTYPHGQYDGLDDAERVSGKPMKLQVPASKERGIQRFYQAIAVAVAGVVVFAVLAVLVNARVFATLDLASARSFLTINHPGLDAASEALAIIFSGELSLVYAGLLAAYFWRPWMRARRARRARLPPPRLHRNHPQVPRQPTPGPGRPL